MASTCMDIRLWQSQLDKIKFIHNKKGARDVLNLIIWDSKDLWEVWRRSAPGSSLQFGFDRRSFRL
jgi:hypothetical protein